MESQSQNPEFRNNPEILKTFIHAGEGLRKILNI